MGVAVNRPIESILDGLDRFRGMASGSVATANDSATVESVLSALNSFSEMVRYLNTRRSRGAILTLEDEASVQDALYLMLRPWINDLTPESPTDKVANQYSIKDFCSRTNGFVIEAKYVRDKQHGKSIVKEINDDIETYRYHPRCDDLIFFIYDPDSNIPDSVSVQRHISESRTYGEKVLRCHGVIKP
jgi:REase_DpnII-MboI